MRNGTAVGRGWGAWWRKREKLSTFSSVGVEGAGRQPEQVQQGPGFCQAGITQQFGCAQNAVQWTANLVAHGGQEHRHGVLGLPGTLDGPLVAGDIVHQDDEAAVQLGGAVLQGAQADVEAASSRVRIQPDGVQFLSACGQDVVEYGLQRVAVVLQRQPVAQRARFGQTQEGL